MGRHKIVKCPARTWEDCFTCPLADCVRAENGSMIKGEPKPTRDGYTVDKTIGEQTWKYDDYTLDWDLEHPGATTYLKFYKRGRGRW